MPESRGMDIIRSGDGSILIRSALFDAANAKITSGTTNVRIWHIIPATGAFETYDFNDDTFKTSAITTPTAAATHRTAENGSYDTGVWTYRHAVLTDFEIGDKYIVEMSHSSLPRPNQLEFQYGDLEGDQATQIPDAVWDENIVAAHGSASTAGLLLRVLGAAISTRSFNNTLNALLGAPDTSAADTVPGQTWQELLTDHTDALTMGSVMNLINAAGYPSTGLIADAVWDENIVAAHLAASSAGLLLNTLGGAISTRANNPTLNALLGVVDTAGADIAWTIWDENIVSGHGTADTAGLLLRVLGAGIAGRANNPTLNALLGVVDTAGADIAWTILDEVIDDVSNHNTANTVAQRLTAIDLLTEAGGDGDLEVILNQVLKLDLDALEVAPAVGSVADRLNDLETILTTLDRQMIVSVNVEGTSLRIEVGIEQYGVMQGAPWVQATAQFYNEAGALIRNVDAAEFGARGPRNFFTFTWANHTLVSGHTYQLLVLISDGAAENFTTTKVFKVISSS